MSETVMVVKRVSGDCMAHQAIRRRAWHPCRIALSLGSSSRFGTLIRATPFDVATGGGGRANPLIERVCGIADVPALMSPRNSYCLGAMYHY